MFAKFLQGRRSAVALVTLLLYLITVCGTAFAAPGFSEPKAPRASNEARYKVVCVPHGFDYQDPNASLDDLPEYKQGDACDGEIRILWFETAVDIAGLIVSLAEFNADPNFWTGIGVVADLVGVAVPFIPSVGAMKLGAAAAKQLIKSSARLHDAFKAAGVRKYWQVKGWKWLPGNFWPSGWQAHHIIEGRFANRFSTSYYNMPAIAIHPDDHKLITNKMLQKIPRRPGGDYSDLRVREILRRHRDAYNELLAQTGDRYWEYLRDYIQEVLERVPSDIQ